MSMHEPAKVSLSEQMTLGMHPVGRFGKPAEVASAVT
jgi:hypothetical protein